MYKQCWVNCTVHTQLKHTSHLFKARFSGKAGSCSFKCGGFFDLPTQGDTILFITFCDLFLFVCLFVVLGVGGWGSGKLEFRDVGGETEGKMYGL